MARVPGAKTAVYVSGIGHVMQRYITFIRGFSAGHSPTEMRHLRSLFRGLGFCNVETYLQSGNVIFDAAPLGIIPLFEAQISRYLTKSLGGEVDAFIRTPEELAQIVDYEPFPDEDTSDSLFVVLLHEPPSDRVRRCVRFAKTATDEFRVNGREVYWLRRQPGDPTAQAWPSIAKTLGVPVTVRTMNTLRKLVANYGMHATGSARSRR
jgi:uncharacterized protein (DUF1697 family)